MRAVHKKHTRRQQQATMQVTKRNGQPEDVHFDKIKSRLSMLAYDLPRVDVSKISIDVIGKLYDGVTTEEIDRLASETSASMSTEHPDYGTLAARILASNLHKETDKSFPNVMKQFHVYEKGGLITDEAWSVVKKYGEYLQSKIVHSRDFYFDYFGLKTLMRSYLLRCDGKIVERPQHLYMRVAVGIHGHDIQCDIDVEEIVKTYDLLSRGVISHASPTMFNACTPQGQLSSCFLLPIVDDSIEGIYDTLKRCATISKTAGGIGLSISNVRGTGAYIAGTGGTSNGLVPMLRNFNATARYVDQGGNKRPGAFSCYLEPWHPDIFEFLDLRKNTGVEEVRTRDLFIALWIPDLFMKRVKNKEMWTLLDPSECPGLNECHGEDFEKLYTDYETAGKGRPVEAQKLWSAIITAQIETGTPYMLYKDACNAKSNQKNLGTIKSSNLCCEVVEYSSATEIAVCNLASINLEKFAVPGGPRYDAFDIDKSIDWETLRRTADQVCENLNMVIEHTHYPLPECKASNLAHRPIGIGVAGFADLLASLGVPYDSADAAEINRRVFEHIYYGALEASADLAEVFGAYDTFNGSPLSEGRFQFDLWQGETKTTLDWDKLREKIVKVGVRNSLLLAPMPTASTAQILGVNESFEPFTSNAYVRRTISGEFQVVNRHLVKQLEDVGLWSDAMRREIIATRGSVNPTAEEATAYPEIAKIPTHIKEVFKTAWEIKQRICIDMAADRGRFICQSQSFNVFIAEPNFGKLSSMHFYGWQKGLKTGMYYLRTRPSADPIAFTVACQGACSL